MLIKRQVVRCAWKREGFAGITWIGYCKHWQWVDLKVSSGREVMTNIVGILLGKPDSIIRCHHYPHEASATTWWHYPSKFLRMSLAYTEKYMPHLAKPE